MDRKKNLAIDIGALVVYLVVANPAYLTVNQYRDYLASSSCGNSRRP